MCESVSHYESMLFNNETTYKTDLRGQIKSVKKTMYKKKSTCLRVPPPPLKFLHTLSDWRVPNIPMNVFIKPKEILHTNPKQIQKPYGHPLDSEREHIQKTRPRVFMIPAISMDDIKDPDVRQRLIDDVYSTTSTKTMHSQNVDGNHSFKAPLPNTLSEPNPIKLSKLEMPYVSPEWRMDTVSWDKRQLRAHADYTKDFWLAKAPTSVIKNTTNPFLWK